jgi:hypothetical protein
MDDFKSMFASKTVIGVLVMLATTAIAKAYHVNITADDQSDIVNYLMDAMQFGSGVFALYGRIAATKQVTVTGAPPKAAVSPPK